MDCAVVSRRSKQRAMTRSHVKFHSSDEVAESRDVSEVRKSFQSLFKFSESIVSFVKDSEVTSVSKCWALSISGLQTISPISSRRSLSVNDSGSFLNFASR